MTNFKFIICCITLSILLNGCVKILEPVSFFGGTQDITSGMEQEEFEINIKSLTPYLTVFIAVLLVSKIPTLALKKISISPKATVFLLLGIGIVFIALLFYTFETLLIFGIVYLISIPLSAIIYINQNKKKAEKISDENHEDIL